MSEENKTPTENQAPIVDTPPPEVSIVRNGLNLVLSAFKIVKGDNKGKQYRAPAVTKENLQAYIQWAGIDNVVSVLQKHGKSVFQSIWFDAIDEKTGEFLTPKFIEEGTKFDVAGLKLKEINELLDEAQEKQIQLMNTSSLDPATGTFPPEITKQLLAVRDQLASLRAMRDERSRKPAKSENEAAPAVEVK